MDTEPDQPPEGESDQLIAVTSTVEKVIVVNVPSTPVRSPPELSAILYCGIAFFLGIQIGSFGPAMLALQAQIHASSLAEVAFGASVRTMTALLSAFAGPLYDRFPGHVLLSGGVTIGGLGTIYIFYATSIAELYACMAALGVTAGFADNGANIMMIWAFKETAKTRKHGQTWLQALHFAFAAGATLGPLVQGALSQYGVSRATLAFAFAGAASTICGLLLCALPSPSPPTTVTSANVVPPRSLDIIPPSGLPLQHHPVALDPNDNQGCGTNRCSIVPQRTDQRPLGASESGVATFSISTHTWGAVACGAMIFFL